MTHHPGKQILVMNPEADFQNKTTENEWNQKDDTECTSYHKNICTTFCSMDFFNRRLKTRLNICPPLPNEVPTGFES